MAVFSAGLMLAAGMANVNAAAVRTWTGAGNPDFNWSNPANWNGNTNAPVAGDYLVFEGSVGLNNTNDLTAYTSFSAITFNTNAGGAFVLNGNGIKVGANGLGTGTANGTGGITNRSSAYVQTFNLQIENDRTTHITCLSNNIVSLQRVWDWRWYKHGPYNLIVSNSVVIAANGQVLGVDGGTMVFNSAPGCGVIGQGLAINLNGVVQLTGINSNQIASKDIFFVNGGKIQIQTTNALGVGSFEEVQSLKSMYVATNAMVENGSSIGPVLLGVGESASSRGYYAGSMRDGGAGALSFRVRSATWQTLAGTNTYTGTTTVTNNSTTGISRLIMDGIHTGAGAYLVSGNPANTAQQAALCGKGAISASKVDILDNAFLAPGGVQSLTATNEGVHTATFAESLAILTFSNTVTLATNTSTVDIHLNGTTPGTGYDQVVIAGSGTFSNNYGNLQLALDVGYTPAAGDKFTIVKVQGTSPANNVGIFTNLNGFPTDLSQGATFTNGGVAFKISYRAEGTTFDAGVGNGNDIMIQAQATSARNLTWRGNGTDNNWDYGITIDWSTNGPSLTTYADGDKVTFDDTGSNNIPVNLVGALSPNTITANASKNYVLFGGSGSLAGPMIINKTNTGTLTLVADVSGNNSGSAIVYQGTLQIGTNDTLGSLTGPIAVQTNGILAHSRSDAWTFTNTLIGAGAFVHAGSGDLIFPVASTFSGRVTNASGIFQLGDGTTADGSITADINVNSAATLKYLAKNSSQTINNTISGNGTVRYDAPAFSARTYTTTTTLTNLNFAGTNIVGANVCLHAADNNSGYALGNGGVVIATTGDGQVWLDRSTTTYNQAFFLSGNGGTSYPFGAMRIFGCTVSGPVTLLGDTRIGGSISSGTIVGPISGGSYTLEVNGGANTFTLSLSNSANAWGNTLVTSGGIRALGPNSISTNAMTIDINGELNAFGNTVAVNSLVDGSGGAGAVYNKSTAAVGTVVVGGDDSNTTFNGTFGDGANRALNLKKVGAGIMTLSATSTNTGTVAVDGGTLALTGTGSFGNAATIAVGTGATLDVSGRGDSTLSLNSGQTLKHSGASVGPITVTGNVTVGSGVVLLGLNRTNAPATNDSVAVSGTFTAGGTLTVTNLGPVLAVGNSFQLFPGAVSGFGTVNLQTVDAANNVQYTWNNTLGSNGKITVASVVPLVNTNAPTVQVSVSGSTLSLAWPTNAGWTLLTNSVSLSQTNQWFPYPNSANLTNVNITIDPTKTNVFFKMVYPYP